MLTWLRENRDGDYWRHGSVRTSTVTDGNGYDRIECPVMIVAGWADGYRNNSFRTVEALRTAGVPHRLLAGPWVHADPSTAYPGPRIDLDVEMVRWWDRWLRGRPPSDEGQHEDRVDVFLRTASPPEPDLDEHAGRWVSDTWPSPATRRQSRPLSGPQVARRRAGRRRGRLDRLRRPPAVGALGRPARGRRALDGVGVAGRRGGAARSPGGPAAAQPPTRPPRRSRRSCATSSPTARRCWSRAAPSTSRSATACTLPDAPSPLVPGEVYDVEVVLDACGYELAPGHRLRLSVAGSDWPNTIAPPAPVRLTVHDGALELPLWRGTDRPAPTFTPGADTASEDPSDITWTVTRDVLKRTTTCVVRHGAEYAVPYDGTASEQYAGEVVVDRRTFAQHATADCTLHAQLAGHRRAPAARRCASTSLADGYDVVIDADAYDGDEHVSHREWTEHLPR